MFFLEGFQSNEFFELLRGLVGKKVYKRQTWFKRVQSSQEEWEKIRESTWTVLKAREMIDEQCNVCKERSAKIKCRDCVADSLCAECDDIIHTSFPFHDRVANGKKLLPLQVLDESDSITTACKTYFIKFKQIRNLISLPNAFLL